MTRRPALCWLAGRPAAAGNAGRSGRSQTRCCPAWSGLCTPRRCWRCHRRQGLHLLGLGCFPVSGAGCPPSQAPPGRAGTQPRRDAHRAQGGLSPWLAVSRPPARPGPPAAPGPGAGKMTAAPRWSRAGVRGSSRTSSAACWRPAAWPAPESPESPAPAAGSSPRWGSRPGRTRELRAPEAAGPPGSLPRRRARSARTRTHAPSPGSQAAPGRCRPELPRYRERGRARPPRLAAGSFISCGAFAGPGRAQPHARLPGAVLRAAPRASRGDREAVHRGRVRCT